MPNIIEDLVRIPRLHATTFPVQRLVGKLSTSILLCFGVAGFAQERVSDDNTCANALGETIFVPAFSRIHTHQTLSQPLASTLVVHNVDTSVPINITGAYLYDDDGALVKQLLVDPIQLAPFASKSFLTELNDARGGIGSNYIIEWSSEEAACSPTSLAVMVGGTGTHGISFVLEGRVIRRETGAEE